MPIAEGHEEFNVDSLPVLARGYSFTEAELSHALEGRVAAILRDDDGRVQLRKLMESVATTDFQTATVATILELPADAPEDWRVGEALAEAYLADHCACEFPWPGGRDLKNPNASPAGTDLVGFQRKDGVIRFAFGEVKTSFQEEWPPSVMTSRHGLSEQLSDLRNKPVVKHALVRYLGFHAANAHWLSNYQTAVATFLGNPEDVALFGVLVRDVTPKHLDLRARAKALSVGCPQCTTIELRAIYLPAGSIASLPQAAASAMGGEPA